MVFFTKRIYRSSIWYLANRFAKTFLYEIRLNPLLCKYRLDAQGQAPLDFNRTWKNIKLRWIHLSRLNDYSRYQFELCDEPSDKCDFLTKLLTPGFKPNMPCAQALRTRILAFTLVNLFKDFLGRWICSGKDQERFRFRVVIRRGKTAKGHDNKEGDHRGQVMINIES